MLRYSKIIWHIDKYLDYRVIRSVKQIPPSRVRKLPNKQRSLDRVFDLPLYAKLRSQHPRQRPIGCRSSAVTRNNCIVVRDIYRHP